MKLHWLDITYNSIFGLQNKHFIYYSTLTKHIGSNVHNISASYYYYCPKLLLQLLCHIILTSQPSEYETTSHLTLSYNKVRRTSFWRPHTSYKASQLTSMVNEVSELSSALTHLILTCLILPCLVSWLFLLKIITLFIIIGIIVVHYIQSLLKKIHLLKTLTNNSV